MHTDSQSSSNQVLLTNSTIMSGVRRKFNWKHVGSNRKSALLDAEFCRFKPQDGAVADEKYVSNTNHPHGRAKASSDRLLLSHLLQLIKWDWNEDYCEVQLQFQRARCRKYFKSCRVQRIITATPLPNSLRRFTSKLLMRRSAEQHWPLLWTRGTAGSRDGLKKWQKCFIPFRENKWFHFVCSPQPCSFDVVIIYS